MSKILFLAIFILSVVVNKTYQDLPRTFEELEFTELDPRFKRVATRIHDGRINEMVHYDVTGIFPTNYSQIAWAYDGGELTYRYVS